MKEDDIFKTLEKDEALLRDLNRNLRVLSRRLSYWRSFWHGVLVALGSTIGIAVAITLLTYTLRLLQVIPGVSSVLETLIDFLKGAR